MNDATTDLAAIDAWWSVTPNANVGIATGLEFVVLDVDPRNGGDATLAAFEAHYGPLPRTAEVATGGGGRHIYLGASTGGTRSGKVGPGLDFQAQGKYVAAPPSVHPETGRPYRWRSRLSQAGLAVVPDWVLEHITGPGAKSAKVPVSAISSGARNDTLTSFAGSLRTWGLDAQAIYAGLDVLNERCSPPLSDGEVRRIADSVAAYPAATAGRRSRPRRQVQLVAASEVEPVATSWAWEPYVPLGGLTLVTGRPGVGKSTLLAYVAAQLARGQLDGDLYGTPTPVLMASAEDSLASTITPRLMAAGADRSLVAFVQIVDDGFTGILDVRDDIDQLADAVRTSGARVLILDPLASFLDADSHNDQKVRRALAPLADMASSLGIAVIALMHLNKRDSPDAMMRVVGSIAFAALARSMMVLGRDAEDQLHLAHSKSNLAPTGPSLLCRVESTTIGTAETAIKTSRLVIEGQSDLSADELLSRSLPSPDDQSKLGQAVAFLQRELAGGVALPSAELHRRAAEEDISKASLRRAERKLHLGTRQTVDTSGKRYWARFLVPPSHADATEETDY